jgi:hypothetical protein
MKRTFLILLVVMILAVSAGCASRSAAATKSRTFNATTVTVTGTVTAVNVTTSPAASQGSKSGSGNPVATGMDEINVKETSGTIATVNLGRDTRVFPLRSAIRSRSLVLRCQRMPIRLWLEHSKVLMGRR